MTQATWSAVDDYFGATLVASDPGLDEALHDSEVAGLPRINVTPSQGKLLHLLARLHGARRILEIGTLGGYSAIWLARALPAGGRLISLELDPDIAAVARRNLERAGLDGCVEIRVGRAIDTLPRLADEGLAPFDFIFIDADKPSNPQYLDWALKLSRPGSVIVVDNVVRNGAIADPADHDPNLIGIRQCLERMANDPRLSATAIQTVGSKGYDGFALAIVSA